MHISRSRWFIVAASGALITAAIVAAVAVAARIPFSSEILRHRLISALSSQLDADVELGSLTLQLFPRPRASGENLAIRFEHRRDVPPLVSVEAFTVDATLGGLWRRRVARVALAGLAINVPPSNPDTEADTEADTAAEPPASPSAAAPEHGTEHVVEPVDEPKPAAAPGDDRAGAAPGDFPRSIIIEELDAPQAVLTILRREPGKPPRVWTMHQLTMRNVGIDSRMPFDTVLTNAVPPGQIAASGTFGPWNRTDPGRSDVAGLFRFERADLSVFKGISGILSAEGRFGGTLDRLVVDGHTTTPDFMVTLSGHPVPLETTYHAVVDATNGNTALDPVDATVLDTRIVARGGVFEQADDTGRIVRLDVTIEGGRLDDIMTLAVNTPRPPMTGSLELTTTMTIPPGPRDVVDKLGLDGHFAIEGGRFTDRDVQTKINELSRRASGRRADKGASDPRVTSDFAGRFHLDDGRLALSRLTFNIPGAVVALDGSYSLRGQTLNFAGDLAMDAKLSQTTTGFKSLLLKLADPFFRRKGRTVVPLTITGTRNAPEFGVDMGRVFRH